jgi:large subunit ribosomal protein L21
MYAVVETGGRQYRLSPGDTIEVEKLAGEVGDTVTLTNVLLLGHGAEVIIGAPRLAGARVEAQIVAQRRGKKIIIFKHKRRKGYRRKQGHRQSLTSLKITGIHTETEDATTALSTEPEDVATALTPDTSLGITALPTESEDVATTPTSEE